MQRGMLEGYENGTKPCKVVLLWFMANLISVHVYVVVLVH